MAAGLADFVTPHKYDKLAAELRIAALFYPAAELGIL
jgi:hypothetical protein